MENYILCKHQQNKVDCKLISPKIDGKAKTTTSDKGGHFILLKRWIQQEDRRFINVCVSNNISPKYKMQNLTEIKEK